MALVAAQASAIRQRLQAAKASGVLLSWSTGRVLVAENDQRAAAPGSLLKPFLLAYALKHGTVRADTRMYCRRSLHVAGRSLPCSHPADQPVYDAAGALAASCNTWFAALAQRLTSGELQAALTRSGLPAAEVPEDRDRKVLLALGLEGTRSTPMQMALAYRALLLRESQTGVVWQGLRGSVQFGMANNARVGGLDVLGKTGTAQDADEWWSHGWFAGGVPGRWVLVVFVPRGDGGTAAALAGSLLRQLAQQDAR